MLTYKLLKRGDKIACPNKECGKEQNLPVYERLATEADKLKYASSTTSTKTEDHKHEE